MWRRLIVALIAGLGACSEPNDIVVPEADVRPSAGISLGTMSFFFPVDLTFDGAPMPAPWNGRSGMPIGVCAIQTLIQSTATGSGDSEAEVSSLT